MFGGDPFDPFGTRRQMRQMEQMMDSMMANPFEMMDDFFGMNRRSQNPMLEDGRSKRQQNRELANPFNSGFGFGDGRSRRQQNRELANPFNSGFGFGGLFGNMMQQMDMLQNEAMSNPDSHVFTQSTMISYDGTGRPKVVSSSVSKTGDVRETRKTLRDGDREEITVGHAIGDREHIIEKKRDKDGRVRKNQRYINLDEEEAETFNREFKTRAQRNMSNVFGNGSTSRQNAIENGRSSRSKTDAVEDMDSTNYKSRKSGGSQPIIEIPDDDDEDTLPSNGRSRPHRSYYTNNNGPIISEITDDETSSKRRKGMFGRFFANDD
uniref:Myeloid leukemia factor n=1 Tax=Panagrolaimus sp. JU765 TaxID=591449 RepID=A0AC34RKA0_9BILA